MRAYPGAVALALAASLALPLLPHSVTSAAAAVGPPGATLEPGADRLHLGRGRRHQASGQPTPEFGIRYENEATFDRANGLSLWGGVRGSGTKDYIPEIWVKFGYAFSRDQGYYDVGALQPVVSGRFLMLGARAFHYAASQDFDDQIIGDTENSLACVLFKEDYRDYYETNGEALLAESRMSAGNTFKVSLRREDLSSLPVATQWSLFRRDDRFRPNPRVNEGSLRAWEASYTFDRRVPGETPKKATRGFVAKVSLEKAGQWGAGGDFTYSKYIADVRNYAKLGPQLYFDIRAIMGRLDVDEDADHPYPLHKGFYVGGVGTLPGYAYKAFRGERFFLANAEYRIGDRPAFLLTADAGDAWTPGVRDFSLHTDAGAGIELAEDVLRVMVARRLDVSDADPVWRLRLTRTF